MKVPVFLAVPADRRLLGPALSMHVGRDSRRARDAHRVLRERIDDRLRGVWDFVADADASPLRIVLTDGHSRRELSIPHRHGK